MISPSLRSDLERILANHGFIIREFKEVETEALFVGAENDDENKTAIVGAIAGQIARVITFECIQTFVRRTKEAEGFAREKIANREQRKEKEARILAKKLEDLASNNDQENALRAQFED